MGQFQKKILNKKLLIVLLFLYCLIILITNNVKNKHYTDSKDQSLQDLKKIQFHSL